MRALRETLLTTSAILLTTTLGCAAGQVTPASAPLRPTERSSEYAIVQGPDTVGYELVTWCANRLISDVSLSRQHAAIHYEASLRGAFPERVELGIWSGGDPVAGPPTQTARHHIERDTAIAEVWKRGAAQVQRTPVAAETFPYWWNYVGLLVQLLEVVGTKTDTAPVPILYVASGGQKGLVRPMRRTDDSLVIRVDTFEIATDWTIRDGLRGAQFTGTAHRIARTSLDAQFASARCAKPPLLRFRAEGQGEARAAPLFDTSVVRTKTVGVRFRRT